MGGAAPARPRPAARARLGGQSSPSLPGASHPLGTARRRAVGRVCWLGGAAARGRRQAGERPGGQEIQPWRPCGGRAGANWAQDGTSHPQRNRTRASPFQTLAGPSHAELRAARRAATTPAAVSLHLSAAPHDPQPAMNRKKSAAARS